MKATAGPPTAGWRRVLAFEAGVLAGLGLLGISGFLYASLYGDAAVLERMTVVLGRGLPVAIPILLGVSVGGIIGQATRGGGSGGIQWMSVGVGAAVLGAICSVVMGSLLPALGDSTGAISAALLIAFGVGILVGRAAARVVHIAGPRQSRTRGPR